jgi:drug/metabolite transporter (DMT)-like permease
MRLIYAISIAIAAQTFIYSGLIFMAGKLFPTALTPIYNLMPTTSYRIVFSTLTIMLIGNYFFQRLYSIQPVLIAGIISTVVGILIVNTGGLIIEQKLPNKLLIMGIIILISGAIVCVYARTRL